MSTVIAATPSIEKILLPSLADKEAFPTMPMGKKIINCQTCVELGFKNLEISHSLEACVRCIKCHTWRTCGQKKHDKTCAGKPPVIQAVVVKAGTVNAKGTRVIGREREIGRKENDPKFVDDCRHFHSAKGVCDVGISCRFAHEIIGKSAKEASGSKRNWVGPCKFFKQEGGCDKGDMCTFSHTKPGISAKEASGNIECFKCRGAHHIDNCDATCTSCGSDQHIADKCIECFNCNEWGHHIKDCESACGYCNETGHKQPQCKKNAYCNDCKKQGHVKQDHCQNCDAEPTFGGNCPCKEHVVATRRNFVGPNK